jgi:hypothetical protein
MYRAKANGPGAYEFWSGEARRERNSVSVDR